MTGSRKALLAAKARLSNVELAALDEIGNAGGEPLPAQVIRDQIEQICEEDGLKYARIAAAAGISSTTLSLFRKRKYKADDSQVRAKLTLWLTTRTMASVPPTADFVATSISRHIHWVCSQAMTNNTLGLIIGPSGIGKDMAIYEYQRGLQNRVIIVECDGVSTGRYGILRETAAAMRLTSALDRRRGYNMADMRDAIIDRLRASRAGGGAGILLIYNEVHLVDYNAVEMVRRLLDKSATGGVLVGTARLAIQLAGKGKAMYEQIRRRCQAVRAFRQVEEVPLDDVRAVAEATAGRPLGKTVLGLLATEANSQEPGHLGKLGRVAALVRQAMHLAGDGKITLEHVDNAVTLLAA